MPLIPFPNIPKLPGVPNIPRLTVSQPTTRLALGLLQGVILRSAQVSDKWGIINSNGEQMVTPNKLLNAVGLGATLSTKAFEYTKETRVSDFPVERGTFASYNKVELPSNPTVIFTFQGTESERRSFLDAIENATVSTELFTIITPEVQYVDHTIESYNYRRTNENGTTLLTVELTLKQVRQVEAKYSTQDKSQITTAKSVGASPAIDSGKVQPKKPEVSTIKALATKLGF